MTDHEKTVTHIQKELVARSGAVSFSAQDLPSHTLRRRTQTGIDLSALNHILEITDEWAVVEPRVTFKQLCKATLARGRMPPVVPEFSTITVGGAIMGAALESSSHRFGQVNDSCLEYELLLGNGERLTASPHQHADLFYGLSGSYGTLALLTKIKLRLIPAQPYVHLTYQRLPLHALIEHLNSPHTEDFVEGIALTPTMGLLIRGVICAEKKHPTFSQKSACAPWYLQHLLEQPRQEEWMPLKDYLFRFDLAAFWMGQFADWRPILSHLLFHKPISRLKSRLHPSFLFRLFCGWMVRAHRLYHLWHRATPDLPARLFFVHDFYAPAPAAKQVCDHFIQESTLSPVWLCPIKGTQTPQLFSPHYGHERYLNIGLYGQPNSPRSVPELAAQLENEIVSYGGRKMLYSYTYYSWEQFLNIYDNDAYMRLRKTYYAEPHFPHLYQKIIA